MFMYVRRNGYTGQPCPVVKQAGKAEPDAGIEKDAVRIYVEVQRLGGEPWRRANKWRNLYRLQGLVAICADTPALAARLAHEAQLVGIPIGYVTNLTDLADGSVAGLWTHCWRSQHSPLEAVTEDEAPPSLTGRPNR